MIMTYDELIERCRQGDPLIDVDDLHSVDHAGLTILGRTGNTYETFDMRVLIEKDGLRSWVRDPEGAEDPFHGPDWTGETFFALDPDLGVDDVYDRLVDYMYAW